MSLLTDVVAWILAVGAFAGALYAILILVKRLWVIFGWRGSFWAWIRRFIDTVDVIAGLPAKLTSIDEKISKGAKKLDDHLKDAGVKTDLLFAVDNRTKVLIGIAEDVRYEVKNNGGGSVKDTVERIESGVKGLYAQPGELGSPGREDVTGK